MFRLVGVCDFGTTFLIIKQMDGRIHMHHTFVRIIRHYRLYLYVQNIERYRLLRFSLRL